MPTQHELRRAPDRGALNHRGIDARFSFHFGVWQALGCSHFSSLHVFNDDRIAAGAGFPMLSHENIEKLMIPLWDTIAHQDSPGNEGVIHPDDVMMMSAGTGIRHSQFNAVAEEMDHLVQVWPDPTHPDTRPCIEQRHFPANVRGVRWQPIAISDGALGSHRIDADVRVF